MPRSAQGNPFSTQEDKKSAATGAARFSDRRGAGASGAAGVAANAGCGATAEAAAAQDAGSGSAVRAASAPADGEPLVALEGVRVTYPDGTEALRGVSLELARGSYTCVIGGNGSGKSTFAQLLNALIVPTEGRVRVFGIDTADPARALEIRSRAAMVFQHPDDQMVTSVVADDVAFGPENLALPQPEIAARVDEALEAVALTPLAQADPADLSGGQKQRAAIAGAFALHPDLLILDEPAAMLDVRGRRGIRRVCRELNQRGITIVHVTHFMDDVLDADRVLVLSRGQLVLDGAPEEVFAHERTVRTLGLDLPATLVLAEKLNDRGVPAPHLPHEDDLARALAALPRRRAAARPGAEPESHPEAARKDATCNGNGEAEPAAISFENVSYSYAAARPPRKRGLLTRLRRRKAQPCAGPWALRDVAFSLAPGSLTALIGHTGAGKSTVIELACALKTPTAGCVRVAGIDTGDLARRRELRRAVGYVSQMPERQLFAETVYDDVAFGPRNQGLSEDEVHGRVRQALELVRLDLDEVGDRSPFALSGGQQRSVALAGVLALKPRILVLDEPMAGLDPAGRTRTVELLRALNGRSTAVLIVTHSMDDAAELADHLVVLDHGAVALEGTPDEVFAQEERLHAIGLGVPHALQLAERIEAAGLVLPRTRPLTLSALADDVAEALGYGAEERGSASAGARRASRPHAEGGDAHGAAR